MHEAKMSPAGGPILMPGTRESAVGVETAPRPSPEPAAPGKDLEEGRSPGPVAPLIPGATLEAIERYAILKTLEAARGSTGRAAAVLQISPRTIQYKLKKYRSEGVLVATPRLARGRQSDPRT